MREKRSVSWEKLIGKSGYSKLNYWIKKAKDLGVEVPDKEIILNKRGFNSYITKVRNDIYDKKLENIKETNPSKYWGKIAEDNKYKNSTKYAEAIKKKARVDLTPSEYRKQLPKLNKKIEQAKKKTKERKAKERAKGDNAKVTNQYGVTITKKEKKRFQSLQKKAEKVRIKEVNRIHNLPDKRISDYILGKLPKFMTGKNTYIPQKWEITLPFLNKKFEGMLSKKDFEYHLKKYEKFAEKGFKLDDYLNEDKTRVMNVFTTGKFSNLSQETQNKFNSFAENLDIATYHSWYENNKDTIQQWYDLLRIDDNQFSDEEIDKEFDKLMRDINSFSKKVNNYYKPKG